MKYFGHVVRYPAERLVRKSVTIEGEGRRKLGKQKQTWRGRVNADMKGARATVEDCKKVEKNGAWFKNPRWEIVEKGGVVARKTEDVAEIDICGRAGMRAEARTQGRKRACVKEPVQYEDGDEDEKDKAKKKKVMKSVKFKGIKSS